MKNLMLMTLILTMSLFTFESYASGNSNEAVQSVEKKASKSKKSRRKKVMMCHECGKPEVECECEGEGHGVKEDHKHD